MAVDLWTGSIQQIGLRQGRDTCATCGRLEFPRLEGRTGVQAIRLCGRQAVQVHPRDGTTVDLESLARRLQQAGQVTRNPYLVRVELDEHQLAIFPDGRILVFGTDDPAMARSLVARYVGS